MSRARWDMVAVTRREKEFQCWWVTVIVIMLETWMIEKAQLGWCSSSAKIS
jgi:hypothetical protein